MPTRRTSTRPATRRKTGGYRKRTGLRRKPAMATLARQVRGLRRVVTAEKKHIGPVLYIDATSGTSSFPVGLTNGTGEGMSLINITPQIIKGDDRNQRNGNAVKLVSACVHINMAGQSAQANNSRLVFEIYQVKGYGLYGTAPTPAVLGSDLFKQDPITGRYSTNCSRNPNYFSKFRLIRRQVVQTPQDNAGSSNFIKNITMAWKMSQMLRYDDSAGGLNYLNTEYFLVVRSNNGNCSATVASASANAALGLNTLVSTGFVFQMYTDFYYFDN